MKGGKKERMKEREKERKKQNEKKKFERQKTYWLNSGRAVYDKFNL